MNVELKFFVLFLVVVAVAAMRSTSHSLASVAGTNSIDHDSYFPSSGDSKRVSRRDSVGKAKNIRTMANNFVTRTSSSKRHHETETIAAVGSSSGPSSFTQAASTNVQTKTSSSRKQSLPDAFIVSIMP